MVDLSIVMLIYQSVSLAMQCSFFLPDVKPKDPQYLWDASHKNEDFIDKKRELTNKYFWGFINIFLGFDQQQLELCQQSLGTTSPFIHMKILDITVI